MAVKINNFDFWDMKAEHYWSSKKTGDNFKKEIHDAIYSGQYMAARKVDGHWYMAIKDMEGNIFLRPRSESVNGGYPNKIDWVPHIKEKLEQIPNGTVLLGEMYFPSNEGSRNVTAIMGCKEEKARFRQNGNPLYFYVFDILALNGELLLEYPLGERIKLSRTGLIHKNLEPFIVFAKYHEGKELEDFIAWIRENDYEGVILQDKNGKYEPGKRPAHKSIKVKKELDQLIDCFLTGNFKPSTWAYTGKEIPTWTYWFDIKNQEKLNGKLYLDYAAGRTIEPITKGAFYGWAGSIEIGIYNKEKDLIVPIAWISNVTEDVKQGIVEENEKWKGRVIKLQAMLRESDTGMFRHAKIVEWRNEGDKDWKECNEI